MRYPVENPKQLETKLDKFGRVRLSKSLFMFDMLYLTIAQAYGLVNIPDHAEVAIEAIKGYAKTCSSHCSSNLALLLFAWHSAALQSIKSYVNNSHTGDKKALVQNGEVQRDFNRERVYRPWFDSLNL